MSLNVIDGRIVEKVSTVPGQVPTVGPSFDHTDGTWVASDVYEAEFFVNVADQKLYMLMNGTIAEIGTSVSASTLAAVLAAGNTTGGNSIIITNGDAIVSDTSNSGIILDNAMSRIVAIDSSIIQTIILDAISTQEIELQTTNTSTSDTSVLRIGAGSTLLLSLDSVGLGRLDVGSNTSFLTHIDLVTSYESRFQALGEEASMYGTNGVTIYKVLATGSGIKFVENTTDILEANLTDIIFYNNTRLDYTPTTNNANTKVLSRNNSTGNIEEMDVSLILPEVFTPTSSVDTSGVVGQLTVDDNYIYVKTSTGWKRSALSTF